VPPFVTKQTLAKRYNTSPRNIERMWKDGRLPPPKYPTGPKKPLGDMEEIEAHERAAISRPQRRPHPDQPEAA
jgi:hypothetical protein